MPTKSHDEIAAFWRLYENTIKIASSIQVEISNLMITIEKTKLALDESRSSSGDIEAEYSLLRNKILDLDERVSGNRSKSGPGEKNNPTVSSRLYVVGRIMEYSTYGPTETAKEQLELSQKELSSIEDTLDNLDNDLNALLTVIYNSGGPLIEGKTGSITK